MSTNAGIDWGRSGGVGYTCAICGMYVIGPHDCTKNNQTAAPMIVYNTPLSWCQHCFCVRVKRSDPAAWHPKQRGPHRACHKCGQTIATEFLR